MASLPDLLGSLHAVKTTRINGLPDDKELTILTRQLEL